MRQRALDAGVPFAQVDQHVSRQFQDAGIPGHSYAGHGGEPNYVVFDPSGVQIQKIYAPNTPLYNPKPVEPRPLAADYPAGAPADAEGNLTHDIEGRPLNPDALIVGRRSVGADEGGVASAELRSLAQGLVGRPVDVVPPGTGDLGRKDLGAIASRYGQPQQISLSDRLSDEQFPRVLGHEVGHAVDMLAGTIPQAGLKDELSSLYNTLNNPTRNRTGDDAVAFNGTGRTRPIGPSLFGYKGADVPPEYMAEAVRAYMADPGAMKATYPTTAAAIRKAVNGNPALNGTIQFNAAALPIPATASPGTSSPDIGDPLHAAVLAQANRAGLMAPDPLLAALMAQRGAG